MRNTIIAAIAMTLLAGCKSMYENATEQRTDGKTIHPIELRFIDSQKFTGDSISFRTRKTSKEDLISLIVDNPLNHPITIKSVLLEGSAELNCVSKSISPMIVQPHSRSSFSFMTIEEYERCELDKQSQNGTPMITVNNTADIYESYRDHETINRATTMLIEYSSPMVKGIENLLVYFHYSRPLERVPFNF